MKNKTPILQTSITFLALLFLASNCGGKKEEEIVAQKSRLVVVPQSTGAVEKAITPAQKETTQVEVEKKAVPEKTIPYDREGRFTVQVCSYKNRDLAEQLVQQLESKGYPAYMEAKERTKNFRVRIGYFKTVEDADRFGAHFKRREGLDYWVDNR